MDGNGPPSGTLTLRLERRIKATPEAVYKALCDPAQLSRWFTTGARADLRVGGEYANADGDQGRFLVVEPPRRLSFTWDNPEHCPGTVVTLTCTPAPDDQTLLTLEHSRLASGPDYDDVRGGWSWALDSLQSYLETGVPIAHDDWLSSQE